MPDDYAGDISTTGVVSVGGSASGDIETSRDEDWFAVTFTAGQIIRVNLDGITLSDTYLYLYDSAGNLLASNDDANGTLFSELNLTITTSGTYYIGASAYGNHTGTYTVTVEQRGLDSPTTNPLLADIDWGTQVSSNTINVYFAPSGTSADGYTSEGFNAYEIGQFQLAFDMYESFTNLSFNVVTDPNIADFTLILDTNEVNGDFLGYFNPPGTANNGVGVFDGASWDRTAGGDLEVGGNGYYTIIHELGHGLGLAHPHDNGGSSTVMDGVTSAFDDYGTWDLNQGAFTIMSYNPGWYTGPAGTTPPGNSLYGLAGTAMAIDIAALQENYGANTSHNTGNNTYTLPGSNGSGTYFQSIWDAGGTDAISYTGVLDAVIDLRAATITEEFGGGGYVSHVAGVAGGFTIAQGVDIENAEGGAGNDTINGNGLGNIILGSSGNDEIEGRGGNDSIDGGGDADTVRGDQGNDTLLGGAGSDFLDGGAGDDSLNGGKNNDVLMGEEGNDSLHGRAGADTLKGGVDDDDLYGGDGGDVLNGNNGNDLIYGGNGNDLIRGGYGQDTINGGTGDDRLFGKGKADIFVFKDGHGDDSIKDFDEFDNNEKIDLSGISSITSLTDLDLGDPNNGAATQVGAAVVIDTGGGNSITIAGVNIADLDAGDFIF